MLFKEEKNVLPQLTKFHIIQFSVILGKDTNFTNYYNYFKKNS